MSGDLTLMRSFGEGGFVTEFKEPHSIHMDLDALCLAMGGADCDYKKFIEQFLGRLIDEVCSRYARGMWPIVFVYTDGVSQQSFDWRGFLRNPKTPFGLEIGCIRTVSGDRVFIVGTPEDRHNGDGL